MRILFLYLLLYLSITSTLQVQKVQSQPLESSNFIKKDLISPADLAVVDHWLFVKDQLESTGEYGIKVFDINTGKKQYEFVNTGRGPGEYLTFDIRKGPKPHTLEVTDSKNKKNDIYNVKCLQKKPPISGTSACITRSMPNFASRGAIVLNNQLVLNTGTTSQGVLFLSNRNKIITQIDSIPKPILQKYNKNLKVAAMTMGGFLVANSSRTRMAFFAEHYDHFIFLKRTRNSVSVVLNHSGTYLPKFKVLKYGGNFALTPSPDDKFAFEAPTSGKNHVYVPYSGKTNKNVEVNEMIEWRAFTKHILVFDWDGKKENELVLSHQVSNIAVNIDETILFGITYNQDLKPSIVKARLK